MPSSVHEDFRCFQLAAEENAFDDLLEGVQLEHLMKGRKGSILVEPTERRGVPIVRTCTKYSTAVQCFRPVHRNLAHQIRIIASLDHEFNNILIENYTNTYATMGYHSDQALDLEDGTSIALFSCYRFPENADCPRKLMVQSKEREGYVVEIPLLNNSVVVFSLDANCRYRHKIVLDTSIKQPANEWLGLTFRVSKTFVQYNESGAYIENCDMLRLAGEEECREFYSLRRRENIEVDFVYPSLAYTISASDLLPPRED